MMSMCVCKDSRAKAFSSPMNKKILHIQYSPCTAELISFTALWAGSS